MNLSNISNETAFGKVLRLPLKLIPRTAVLTIRNGPLKGKKWIAGSHTHGCWLGSYEQEKQRLFAQTVTEGSVVFDIGANVGFYTLLASVLAGPKGHVYAFEPLPRNLEYLKEHLRLNQIENVTMIEAAVADRNGVTLFNEGANSAMGHLSADGKLEVEVVALDDLISQGKIQPPDFMKLDVEGGELLVLRGAKITLPASEPDIFLATHGKQVHLQCCELLRLVGYELRSVDGREESDELLAQVASENRSTLEGNCGAVATK